MIARCAGSHRDDLAGTVIFQDAMLGTISALLSGTVSAALFCSYRVWAGATTIDRRYVLADLSRG